MSKILLTFLMLLSSLFAGSLEFANKMSYETSYNNALNKAIKQNKPIMMVISTKTCPWCRKLERQTLKKNMINEVVQKNFIPVTLTRDIDNYPKQFDAKVVPTIFFIDPNKQKTIHKSLGYKNKQDFKKELLKAIEKNRS